MSRGNTERETVRLRFPFRSESQRERSHEGRLVETQLARSIAETLAHATLKNLVHPVATLEHVIKLERKAHLRSMLQLTHVGSKNVHMNHDWRYMCHLNSTVDTQVRERTVDE